MSEEQRVPTYQTFASFFSKCVYEDSKDKLFPPEFEIIIHEKGDPSRLRSTEWAIYRSESLKLLILSFRGSTITTDWVSNVICHPIQHPNYPNVHIHADYVAEVEREYDYIRPIVLHWAKEEGYKIIATGHDRGGGLAQVFTHRLFNEGILESQKKTLWCITFGTPMVFWSTEENLPINSGDVMLTFAIRGDPVPFLPILLSKRHRALNSLLPGGVPEALVAEHSSILEGYRLVGGFHIAVIPDLKELRYVEFTKEAEYDLKLVEEFIMNYTPIYSYDYHPMRLYHEIIDPDYITVKEIQKKHKCGLYFRNDADVDVLIILTQLTPLHWIRVPSKKTRYLRTGVVWFTVNASIYDPKNVPTNLGVAFQISAITLKALMFPVVAVVAPEVVVVRTAVAAAQGVYATGKALTNPGKDFMRGVYADGQTIKIKHVNIDGVKTDFLQVNKVK